MSICLGSSFGVIFGTPCFGHQAALETHQNESKSPPAAPWEVLGRLWSDLACFWGPFWDHFWLQFHTFSDLPKTLNFNDLTLLFNVFSLLKALLLGYLLGSVLVPISDPSKNYVWRLPGHPLEPTWTHIKSSGALFGTQGADFKKMGVPKTPPRHLNCIQNLVTRTSVEAPGAAWRPQGLPKQPRPLICRFGLHFCHPRHHFCCFYLTFGHHAQNLPRTSRPKIPNVFATPSYKPIRSCPGFCLPSAKDPWCFRDA